MKPCRGTRPHESSPSGHWNLTVTPKTSLSSRSFPPCPPSSHWEPEGLCLPDKGGGCFPQEGRPHIPRRACPALPRPSEGMQRAGTLSRHHSC